MDEALIEIYLAFDHVKEAVRSVLQAQQQADIASAQMTYQAGMTVENWLSENIGDWINKLSIYYSLVANMVEIGALMGLYFIPVAGQVIMIAASVGFGIYGFIQEVS